MLLICYDHTLPVLRGWMTTGGLILTWSHFFVHQNQLLLPYRHLSQVTLALSRRPVRRQHVLSSLLFLWDGTCQSPWRSCGSLKKTMSTGDQLLSKLGSNRWRSGVYKLFLNPCALLLWTCSLPLRRWSVTLWWLVITWLLFLVHQIQPLLLWKLRS